MQETQNTLQYFHFQPIKYDIFHMTTEETLLVVSFPAFVWFPVTV